MFSLLDVKKCEKIMKNVAVHKKKHYNRAVFLEMGVKIRFKDAFSKVII